MTVNFTKDGKPVSKDFRSNEEVVRYFRTEVTRLDAKEKALGQKHPELRAIIEKEKRDCERTITFFKHLINERKTMRNDVTGEVIEIEYRSMEA